MNALQTHFWAVRDYLAPVLRESKFKEHGRITPDEFVAAGDFLVYKFPTWSWSVGDTTKIREFLPKEKQFLISRGVPCLRRVSQIESQAVGSTNGPRDPNGTDSSEKMINFQDGNERKGKGDDEDWLATHVDEPPSSGAGGIVDIPDSEPPLGASTMTSGEEDDLARKIADAKIAATSSDPLSQDDDRGRPEEIGEIPDIQDIPDMDDEDEEANGMGMGVGEEIEENDPANAAIPNPTGDREDGSKKNLLSVRTYDCLITYDKYYQTPRMWLIGYDESGKTLKPKEIFQDISSDYAQKTVTIEPFPHTQGLNTASIHPCKHANVMKKVIERMDGTVRDEQRKAKMFRNQSQSQSQNQSSNSNSNPNLTKEEESEKKKKKLWSVGGAIKKATGKDSASSTGTSTSTSSPTPTAAGEEEEESEVEGLRVDQYMIIFLKFMASIVPAIEIDATQAV